MTVLVATHIEHGVNQRNLQYRQAAKISEADEFATAMQTDVGNAFVSGAFEAVDRVRHEKLDGEWLYIEAVYRKYTMHTRIVHYTTSDGKGHTRHHTRTEHYWTWDAYDSEVAHSKRVRYIGSEFDYGKFSYAAVRRSYKTVSNGHHRRIDFETIRPAFRASAYTVLANGTVGDRTALCDGVSTEELYEAMTHSIAVSAFWLGWGILSVCLVFAFVALKNRWLEDRPESPYEKWKRRSMR